MEINRRDFITKVSAIAALSVLPSSFVAAMGNEKVEKAKPKYPTLKCDVVVVGAGPGGVPAATSTCSSRNRQRRQSSIYGTCSGDYSGT